MEHRPLGRTGVQVSKLCLGTMMFGACGNTDHHDSIRIIHAALDAGVNFLDTADVYSAGESEEIVGKALKVRRADVVLASVEPPLVLGRGDGGPVVAMLRRDQLKASSHSWSARCGCTV
jgi:aryl-alcohol dehydrogenase-like predicted oxidoreductase